MMKPPKTVRQCDCDWRAGGRGQGRPEADNPGQPPKERGPGKRTRFFLRLFQSCGILHHGDRVARHQVVASGQGARDPWQSGKLASNEFVTLGPVVSSDREHVCHGWPPTWQTGKVILAAHEFVKCLSRSPWILSAGKTSDTLFRQAAAAKKTLRDVEDPESNPTRL
jgi:hypothetical protein